jgi:hypothetical protein
VSKIEFEDGVNIVHGPSNTGKSYILGCLNFMFGGKDTPFSKADTNYDVIAITFVSNDGKRVCCKRMIIEGRGKKKEVGSNTIEFTYSDIPEFPVGNYYVDSEKKDSRPYSEFLLFLLGVTKSPQIISTKKRETNVLSLRTIFQFFYLDEDNIFKKGTVFYPNHPFTKPVAILMSLIYLFEEKDFAEEVPTESEKEREQRKIQKAGVIQYLKRKLQAYTDQRTELQKMEEQIGDEDIEGKLQSILDEITDIESAITEANEKCRQILEQIFEITPQLEEVRLRRERFRILHTQYDSDIKRLQFIADGESKRGKIQRATRCPFCNHDMDLPQKEQVLYSEAISIELERVKAQVQDLELAERDTNTEIQALEKTSAELNRQYQQLKDFIENRLQPRATKLTVTKESYQNWLLLQQKLYAFDFITQEYNDEITTRSLETEEKVTDIDPMQKFPVSLWKTLSKAFQEMVKACGYPSNPTARIDKDSLDAVVNEKAKENEGKGYRAFLNTIMLFNLMKLLESDGKHSLHMLFLDSPVLSLKEKETVKETELASPGMRESLFRYIITHCGENQVIIIENELPQNVDYRTAHLIPFTKAEDGRYGFLLSVRDTEK